MASNNKASSNCRLPVHCAGNGLGGPYTIPPTRLRSRLKCAPLIVAASYLGRIGRRDYGLVWFFRTAGLALCLLPRLASMVSLSAIPDRRRLHHREIRL